MDEVEISGIYDSQRRKKRTDAQIQQDIERYNELIRSNLDMENDIPPRRSEAKTKTEPTSKRASARINTKSKSKRADTRAKTNIKTRYATKCSPTLKRPQYTASNSVAKPTPLCFRKGPVPVPLKSYTGSSYESHISLNNNYSNLIALVKQHTDRKSESDAIDIPLSHHFVAKNIEQEASRFSVPDDYYDTKSALSVPAFSRTDLDTFFLNLGSTPGNSSESIEMLKKIPLA